MHALQEHARKGPHLEMVASVATEGTGQFVLHRDHVFMSARYGSAHTLSIIDVQNLREPKLVQTMKFKRAISSVAVQGDILYAAESGRALNFIDIENPTQPSYFDCGVALGTNLYDLKLLGGWAVLGLNWDGIGLMDVRDLKKARWADKIKLEEGFIERLVVASDLIFAAGASGGLRVYEIRDSKLVEIAQPCGEGFNASRVFTVGEEVWVLGSPEDESEHLVVIDPANPDKVATMFEPECSGPTALLPIGEQRAVGFYTHYTCAAYAPHDAWAGELFKQYTRDDDNTYIETPCDVSEMTDGDREAYDVSRTCLDNTSHALRKEDYIIAALEKELAVFAIPEDSVFRSVPT